MLVSNCDYALQAYSESAYVTDIHISSLYDLALMMLMKSGLSDAPPTRNPSMSGWVASSLQLAAVTEPRKVTNNLKGNN